MFGRRNNRLILKCSNQLCLNRRSMKSLGNPDQVGILINEHENYLVVVSISPNDEFQNACTIIRKGIPGNGYIKCTSDFTKKLIDMSETGLRKRNKLIFPGKVVNTREFQKAVLYDLNRYL